jgi:hypothetical protein
LVALVAEGRVAVGVVFGAGFVSFFGAEAALGAGLGSGLCVALAVGLVAEGDFAGGLVFGAFVEMVLGRVVVVFLGALAFAVAAGAVCFGSFASFVFSTLALPLAPAGAAGGLFSFFGEAATGSAVTGSAGSNEGDGSSASTFLSGLTLGSSVTAPICSVGVFGGSIR